MSKKTIPLGLSIAALVLMNAGCKEKKTAEDYLHSGQAFYEQELLGKARVQYRNALALDATNGDAHFGLATLAKDKQDLAARQFHLQKAVEFSPKNVTAIFELGEISLLMGDLPVAQKSVKLLAQLQPETLVYYKLALAVAIAEDQWQQAQTLGGDALKAFPENAELWGLVGVVAKKQEQWPQALKALDKAIALDEKNPQYRVLRIEVNEARGDVDASILDLKALIDSSDYSDAQIIKLIKLVNDQRGRPAAIDELNNYLQKYPQADALQVLLVDLVKQDDPERAGKLLDEFIRKANNPTGLLFYRVNVAFSHNNVVLAQQDLNALVALPNQTPKALAQAKAMQAELAWLQGDWENAQTLAMSVLALDANHVDALLLRAKLLVREGRSGDAVVYLNKVLAQNAQSVDALSLLAEHYQRQGNTSLAKDFYRRIGLVDPDNYAALRFHIYEAFSKEHLTNADALVTRALKRYPEDAALLGIKLQVAALRANYTAAIAILEQLKALDVNTADALFFEGFIQQQQGDYAKAMASFGKAVSARGQYDKALKAMFASANKAKELEAFKTFLLAHTEKNAHDLTAHLLIAQLTFEANPVAAINRLSGVTQAQPSWHEGIVALSKFKLYHGDTAEALALLKNSYTQSKNSGVGIAYARMLEQQAQAADAGAVYETLLQVDSNNDIVRNNYALLLVGELFSQASLRKALQLTEGFASSNSPALLDTQGVVLMAADKFTEANYAFNKALGLADIAEIKLHYADSLYRSGKQRSGREMLEELENKNVSEGLAVKIALLRERWAQK